MEAVHRKIKRPLEDKLLDVYEVLREKEVAITGIRQEIDALRLVCQMLEDGDHPIPNTSEASTKGADEQTSVVSPVSERQAILAGIRARLEDAKPNDLPKKSCGVLVQFTHSALGASRALFKRVSHNRLLERRPEHNAIRNLFERFGRNAA
jgi:hypothetical protein